MDLIKKIEGEQLKNEVPVFNVGDTIKVSMKIVEGDRERVQVFQGTVIARCGNNANETFTVRRVVYGEGVERVFLLHSPRIVDIEVTRRGKVRRAKLYYLKDKVGKGARVKEMKR
ncbi:MAG: 50S ribosomal protein L19 [Candidatus Auribacterota bacterium]|jgi:large subunit ribosomal protein L19|nr:50S ribosomal protein L19 [Candidatus Auribacterota bacterium]